MYGSTLDALQAGGHSKMDLQVGDWSSCAIQNE